MLGANRTNREVRFHRERNQISDNQEASKDLALNRGLIEGEPETNHQGWEETASHREQHARQRLAGGRKMVRNREGRQTGSNANTRGSEQGQHTIPAKPHSQRQTEQGETQESQN